MNFNFTSKETGNIVRFHKYFLTKARHVGSYQYFRNLKKKVGFLSLVCEIKQ